jgi:hypothetical protein
MKTQRTRPRLLSAAVGCVFGMMLAGGVAFATIPSANGVINGCYEKRIGILRVIDAEAGKRCTSLEAAISWNQQGPQGLQGERGLQGVRGPQGESGKLALAGQACPEGRFVTGFDSAGNVTCSGGGGGGGGAEPGALSVTPAGLNFGPVPVSQTSQQQLTVTNTGGSPIEVTSFSSAPRFSVSGSSSCGTLDAGSTCSIYVDFQPIALGTYVETLTVTGVGGVSGVTVTLVGTGVVP